MNELTYIKYESILYTVYIVNFKGQGIETMTIMVYDVLIVTDYYCIKLTGQAGPHYE